MRQPGFTLVEMLVVITILTILASIAYSGLSSLQRAAKRHETQLILDKVDAALRTFKGETGFYPRGAYALPPVQYETSGYDRGLVKLDASTGLPTTDNDDTWAPATTPSIWTVGNGLFASLGTKMSQTDRDTAIGNANVKRNIEIDRSYHIGSFGNTMCDGLATPPGWVPFSSTAFTTANAARWAHYDPVAAESLGERDLKRVFDHFRCGPIQLIRDSGGNDRWFGFGMAAVQTSLSSVRSGFQSYLIQLFPLYVAYARPRDAADAYIRALRDGVAAGSITYDSFTDATGVAQGSTITAKTRTLATPSVPWHDDYLGDQLSDRLRRDVDGDGKEDILDAYGQPLAYLCEGLPARTDIYTKTAGISQNPHIGTTSPNQCGGWKNFATPIYASSVSVYNPVLLYPPDPPGYVAERYGAGFMLLYHPDPDNETTERLPGGYAGNFRASYGYVTDRPNAKGVPVRADAMDIALIDRGVFTASGDGQTVPTIGSEWLWARHGVNLREIGDPYWLPSTTVPSRVAVRTEPTNIRSLSPYYCLSKDGTRLVEPWLDDDGDGVQGGSEPFWDRTKNLAYDDDVAAVDARVCAPLGEEREFELVSAGRNGLYHAQRPHAANTDNLRPQKRKQ